jgi:hypothetical protein
MLLLNSSRTRLPGIAPLPQKIEALYNTSKEYQGRGHYKGKPRRFNKQR